jgi:ABC-type dipeptide/oligopeptide/nickel transport system ATPase component
LRKIGLDLNRGEILGLVGESGSGKSLLARSLMRLEAPARIVEGSILLNGRELVSSTQKEMAALRGKTITLVLQNPEGAMDPLFTMGYQFKEVLAARTAATPKPGKRGFAEVEKLLADVGVADPRRRCRQYPHEWSRGMLQRGQLVMGVLTAPEVMILDEITSALDPTVCLQILDAVRRLKAASGAAILLITHDLFLASEICDRVAVMQGGEIVEAGRVEEIFDRPAHPYTRALVACVR